MTVALARQPIHEDLHQSAVRQTLALARRSVLGRIRQPAVLAPSFVFPLFFAALSASSYSRVKNAPGFPKVDSFLQFGLAAAVMQGAFFGATSAAADLAVDIEQGFWERLMTSPVHRTSIVIGRLMSSLVVGALQATVFIGFLAAFGVRVRSGPIGIVSIVVSASLVSLAMSTLMSTFAIKTGSPEVVQGMFPLVFVLMFLSSTFMPRELMHGWFRRVVDVNPISYLAEGMRGFVIERDLSAWRFFEAIAIPSIGCVLALLLCLRALRRRLAQM
ncbi:MAG: ABC transporter permease [Actinomycetota bacterium]